jgi:hypothetical protein
MSEYQYDEFQAIDRPLSEADRRALRDISTRARITSPSFTNTYEWGDLKADPARLVERYFDLFLYVAIGDRIVLRCGYRNIWWIWIFSMPS